MPARTLQLCCIWLTFRQVFWALSIVAVGGWNPAAFYLLYWLPHPIQFGSFLLLPLFYLQVGGLTSSLGGRAQRELTLLAANQVLTKLPRDRCMSGLNGGAWKARWSLSTAPSTDALAARSAAVRGASPSSPFRGRESACLGHRFLQKTRR